MGVYSDEEGGLYYGEPEDEGKRLMCVKCKKPIRVKQVVSYEPVPNTITHVEPKCADAKPLGAGPRDPQWAKEAYRKRRGD